MNIWANLIVEFIIHLKGERASHRFTQNIKQKIAPLKVVNTLSELLLILS